LRFNEHLEHEEGALVFAHACKLGLEGIVSKRRNSPYIVPADRRTESRPIIPA
jgi:bifunctional non-homologous end joining protein LigD